MNTIPNTEILLRPPANDVLPPGHVWKQKPEVPTKSNPPRKYVPETKLGNFAYLS